MNTADRRFWIQGLIGKKVSFLVYFMIQAPGKKFPFSVQYIGSDLMKNTDVTSHTYTRLTKTTVVLPRGRSISVTGGDNGIIVFSKIGVVVYYQCCVLIGWASEKRRLWKPKQWRLNRVLLAKVVLSRYFWPTSWILLKQLFLSPSWPLSQ